MTHWIECGVITLLQEEDIGKMALLVFRILVRAGLDSPGLKFEEGSAKATYDSKDYNCVYQQCSHEELRDPGDLFKRIFTSLFMVNLLSKSYFFGQEKANIFDPENKDVIGIVRLAMRHLQSCSCNAYEIGEMRRIPCKT